MDRRSLLTASTLIVIALIVGSAILTVSAAGANQFHRWLWALTPFGRAISQPSTGNGEGNGKNNAGIAPVPMARGWGQKCGRGWSIEISDEFKENVIAIAEGDPDVQSLIEQGYNITNVMPKIALRVEGDGTVTMKATSAVVVLRNGSGGWAQVWVDIEQGKVTRIIIASLTVIEKS
ncbi:MAG: hypothetical protein RMJ07_00890 [Nitrososphaerota archaeon]|nr:hypothetical protein [Candidatus Bathyarchaeota archaeon]MDW8048228.1 hypothetical protein [Nitrososphaerota archaeon]